MSILVPVYNVEKFFSRCLESLFSQTYSDIEYVFVNDCTPDNSMKILSGMLKKYPSRATMVKIINNSHNRGIAIVRNTLLENATGDYILFVDSDDWIEKDMVENLVDRAASTDADIVGCDYYEDYPDKMVICNQHYPSDHKGALRDMTLLRIKGVLWKLLIRRELIVQNKLTFMPEIHFGGGYILSCSILPKPFHLWVRPCIIMCNIIPIIIVVLTATKESKALPMPLGWWKRFIGKRAFMMSWRQKYYRENFYANLPMYWTKHIEMPGSGQVCFLSPMGLGAISTIASQTR